VQGHQDQPKDRDRPHETKCRKSRQLNIPSRVQLPRRAAGAAPRRVWWNVLVAGASSAARRHSRHFAKPS
jgi:hypothetical protein